MNLFKTGDKADPGNDREMTLLSTSGKTAGKTLSEWEQYQRRKEENINDGQAGLRPNP